MQQITRDNHYVPQWYQRGFLSKNKHKLHVLNLLPGTNCLPNGQIIREAELEELGPKLVFVERDLYTIRRGQLLNDEIETFLFGKLDKNGADAVRGWISGNAVQIHRKFLDFFEYMDAQKLRTPKGLDWIQKHFNGLPHIELMRQMQAVRQMHCTMWSECVREIVVATDSPVKFLISDHPVTIYNPKLVPDAQECGYPDDPGIELVGSQTIFPLDRDHCLILTNLEYAKNPKGAEHLSRRTNARFRGESMARTDAFIRDRKLSEMEVHAVNRILKSRARKYVAAGNSAWLYPEKQCDYSWEDISNVLLPRKELWRFGGEIFIGYKDGSSAYRDQFGRTSKAHEFLVKPALKENPAPEAACGCGSGIAFKDCCADIAPTLRPTWRVMSIRERNLLLIRAIHDIFLTGENRTWLDIRRDLSDIQVRRIHEVFASLWPTDTRLIDLLPSPQRKRSRALFLGMMDARTVCTLVVGMLAYVDEVVVVNPFVNANVLRPEFSPIQHPAQHRDQTLRNIFTMLALEPFIAAGRVHLIPDPLDYDMDFRQEILTITSHISENESPGPIDKAFFASLGREELKQFMARLPLERLKEQLKRNVPDSSTEITDTDLNAMANFMKKELEKDPLALLDPPPMSESGGEFKVMKCFSRETGLYIATLTGAIIYTNSDTMWARLHDTDGVRFYEPDHGAAGVIGCQEGLRIQVPAALLAYPVELENTDSIREWLRKISVALRWDEDLDTDKPTASNSSSRKDDDYMHTFELRLSVPSNGFQRTDVSRLVLTFGRLQDVVPVRLGIFLQPVESENNSKPEPAK